MCKIIKIHSISIIIKIFGRIIRMILMIKIVVYILLSPLINIELGIFNL